MKNPSEIHQVKFDKIVNFAALSVLILWLSFIFVGIFILVYSIITVKTSFIILLFESPIGIVACLIMFYSSKIITHSLMDLSKNKKWVNPGNFLKHILIQVATAIIATIVSLAIYGTSFFTNTLFLDFVLLFSLFIFTISIGFISYCIYCSSMEFFYSQRLDTIKNY